MGNIAVPNEAQELTGFKGSRISVHLTKMSVIPVFSRPMMPIKKRPRNSAKKTGIQRNAPQGMDALFRKKPFQP